MKRHYEVDATQLTLAGEASSDIKKRLKKLGFDSTLIRRVSIAVYEAEINMVIHANGGTIDTDLLPHGVSVILKDQGPGIPDIELAMQEGYTTASNTAREMGFGAGMGLPNMKRYSDSLDITSKVDEGTTVEMFFHI